MGETVKKLYEDADLQVDEGKREVISIINTDAIDRDGEVVQPKGMKRKNFAGNPVVFVNHDYSSPPIGKSLWIKSGSHPVNGRDVLIAKTYISDKTQESKDIFGLMQDGVLRAFSIGFNPIRKSAPTTQEINTRPELKSARLIHREWELLEYSAVGVPCNPEAISLAVSKCHSPLLLKMLKDQGTVTAADQIVTDVIEVKAEHPISKNDFKKILAKRLDTFAIAIDTDRAVELALKHVRSMS